MNCYIKFAFIAASNGLKDMVKLLLENNAKDGNAALIEGVFLC